MIIVHNCLWGKLWPLLHYTVAYLYSQIFPKCGAVLKISAKRYLSIREPWPYTCLHGASKSHCTGLQDDGTSLSIFTQIQIAPSSNSETVYAYVPALDKQGESKHGGFRMDTRQYCFMQCMVKLWNSLPQEQRQPST